ncbi:MAG: hypothetical protein Q4F00_07835 [bacterium]|nr:hypothetical protein [bacterium]
MRYWTVQSNEVIQIIENDGVYYPDFRKSRYSASNKSMKVLYTFMLKSFNSVNKSSYKGLIFTFVKFNNNGVTSFNDIEDFTSFISSKSYIVKNMWDCFSKNSQILEIDMEHTLNPLFIDINDYQIIMPEITPGMAKLLGIPQEYVKAHANKFSNIKQKLMLSLQNGDFVMTSNYSCNLIQAHLPYIKKEDICNKYPLFHI